MAWRKASPTDKKLSLGDYRAYEQNREYRKGKFRQLLEQADTQEFRDLVLPYLPKDKQKAILEKRWRDKNKGNHHE